MTRGDRPDTGIARLVLDPGDEYQLSYRVHKGEFRWLELLSAQRDGRSIPLESVGESLGTLMGVAPRDALEWILDELEDLL